MIINGETFFRHKESYHRVPYVDGLGAFIIESANSIEKVEKNVLEDSGVYSLSLGEEKLLSKVKDDLLKYYIN